MCSIRIPQLGSEGRRRWFGRWPKYNGKEFLTFRKVRFLPSVILTSTLLRKTLICARSSDYTARWLSEGPVSHSPAWGSLPCNCCNLCVGLQFLHESSFRRLAGEISLGKGSAGGGFAGVETLLLRAIEPPLVTVNAVWSHTQTFRA